MKDVWSGKSTYQLKIVLASLLRYQSQAKTDREKGNSARNIAKIKEILRSRGEL